VNTQSGKLVTGLPAMSANALYIVDHPSATVQRSAAKLHRKQIPLCRFHHLEIEKGKYYPMDPDFLKEVLRTNAPAHLQDLKVLHIIENAEKETQGGPKGRFFSTARSYAHIWSLRDPKIYLLVYTPAHKYLYCDRRALWSYGPPWSSTVPSRD
jgi:hypothetical protein